MNRGALQRNAIRQSPPFFECHKCIFPTLRCKNTSFHTKAPNNKGENCIFAFPEAPNTHIQTAKSAFAGG